MATESLFMQIEGVKGTVSNKGFEGWIAVENMNFGVYCSAKIDNASGQVNSDGVNFDAISFSKVMDKKYTLSFKSPCKLFNIGISAMHGMQVVNQKLIKEGLSLNDDLG